MKAPRIDKKSICVMSPHLDDALLCLCDNIIQWKKDGYRVLVWTVFTSFTSKSIPKYSTDYMLRSGFQSAASFERHRHTEDIAAMKALGVTWRHLGFIDGGFRANRGALIYPTSSRLFSGVISRSDHGIIGRLTKIMASLGKFQKVYVPLGVGSHVDHLIVRLASERVIELGRLGYYVDFPYALYVRNWRLRNVIDIIQYKISCKRISSLKKQIMNLYSSQVGLLFSKTMYYPEVVLHQKR